MNDRERLAKLLDDAYKSVPESVHSHRVADALLAAGVTLPPAPAPLVTTEMISQYFADAGLAALSPTPREVKAANALAAAAIRQRVAEKTGTDGNIWVEGLAAVRLGHTLLTPHMILALFGLDGGAA